MDTAKTKPPCLREHLLKQVEEQSDFCDVTVQLGTWVSEGPRAQAFVSNKITEPRHEIFNNVAF